MALIDDDEVEEVRWIFSEVGTGVPILGWSAHEGLENREEDAAVLRHLALFADVPRLDPYQRVLGERREAVEGLIREDVPVCQKENAWAARGLAAQIPTAVEYLPGNLKGTKS